MRSDASGAWEGCGEASLGDVRWGGRGSESLETGVDVLHGGHVWQLVLGKALLGWGGVNC